MMTQMASNDLDLTEDLHHASDANTSELEGSSESQLATQREENGKISEALEETTKRHMEHAVDTKDIAIEIQTDKSPKASDVNTETQLLETSGVTTSSVDPKMEVVHPDADTVTSQQIDQDDSHEEASKSQDESLEDVCDSKEESHEDASKSQEDTLEEDSKSQEDTLEEDSKSQEDTLEEDSKSQEDSLEEDSKSQEDTLVEDSKSQEDSLEEDSKSQEDTLEEDSKSQEDTHEEDSKSQEDTHEEDSKSQDDTLEEDSKSQEDTHEDASKSQEDSLEKDSKSQDDTLEEDSKYQDDILEGDSKSNSKFQEPDPESSLEETTKPHEAYFKEIPNLDMATRTPIPDTDTQAVQEESIEDISESKETPKSQEKSLEETPKYQEESHEDVCGFKEESLEDTSKSQENPIEDDSKFTEDPLENDSKSQEDSPEETSKSQEDTLEEASKSQDDSLEGDSKSNSKFQEADSESSLEEATKPNEASFKEIPNLDMATRTPIPDTYTHVQEDTTERQKDIQEPQIIGKSENGIKAATHLKEPTEQQVPATGTSENISSEEGDTLRLQEMKSEVQSENMFEESRFGDTSVQPEIADSVESSQVLEHSAEDSLETREQGNEDRSQASHYKTVKNTDEEEVTSTKQDSVSKNQKINTDDENVGLEGISNNSNETLEIEVKEGQNQENGNPVKSELLKEENSNQFDKENTNQNVVQVKEEPETCTKQDGSNLDVGEENAIKDVVQLEAESEISSKEQLTKDSLHHRPDSIHMQRFEHFIDRGRCYAKEDMELFYGCHSPFSLDHKAQFTVRGQSVEFNSAAQYILYRKAVLFKSEDIVPDIMYMAPGDTKMKSKLEAQIEDFDYDTWMHKRVHIVKEANWEKFSQNADLKYQLLATRSRLLVKTGTENTTWGIGLDREDPLVGEVGAWKGDNILGFVLMEVRNELMEREPDWEHNMEEHEMTKQRLDKFEGGQFLKKKDYLEEDVHVKKKGKKSKKAEKKKKENEKKKKETSLFLQADIRNLSIGSSTNGIPSSRDVKSSSVDNNGTSNLKYSTPASETGMSCSEDKTKSSSVKNEQNEQTRPAYNKRQYQSCQQVNSEKNKTNVNRILSSNNENENWDEETECLPMSQKHVKHSRQHSTPRPRIGNHNHPYKHFFEDDNLVKGREKMLFFFGSHWPFSQHHPATLDIDGKKYNCAEQYYMYKKAELFENNEVATEILRTEDPKVQKRLGKEVQGYDFYTWMEHSVSVVKEASLAKFSQNPELKYKLVSTYPRILVEASPGDSTWGIGLAMDDRRAGDMRSWRGENLLGFILMDVREELIKTEPDWEKNMKEQGLTVPNWETFERDNGPKYQERHPYSHWFEPEHIVNGRENFLFFFGSHYPFSQHHAARFTIDEREFNCSEQYFMYSKAALFKDWDTADKIMETDDPKKQKGLGRRVRGFSKRMWNDKSVDAVKRANIEKFTQNAKLKYQLLSTSHKILVEASPFDNIWGIGLNSDDPRACDMGRWKGDNLLGFILMEVRQELMEREPDWEKNMQEMGVHIPDWTTFEGKDYHRSGNQRTDKRQHAREYNQGYNGPSHDEFDNCRTGGRSGSHSFDRKHDTRDHRNGPHHNVTGHDETSRRYRQRQGSTEHEHSFRKDGIAQRYDNGHASRESDEGSSRQRNDRRQHARENNQSYNGQRQDQYDNSRPDEEISLGNNGQGLPGGWGRDKDWGSRGRGNDGGSSRCGGNDGGSSRGWGNDGGSSRGRGNDGGSSRGRGNDGGSRRGGGNDGGSSGGWGNDGGSRRGGGRSRGRGYEGHNRQFQGRNMNNPEAVYESRSRNVEDRKRSPQNDEDGNCTRKMRRN